MATGTQSTMQDDPPRRFDFVRERERVERGAFGGIVVASLHLGPVPLLAHQLGRRAEVVVRRLPQVPVQRVDFRAQLRVFEPPVAEKLPHVSPVLLLDGPLSSLWQGRDQVKATRRGRSWK